MVVEVADIVKGYMSSLTFIDKLAGLVKPISKTDLDENNRKVTKTFPVACSLDFEDCITNSKYKDLIPDSKLKCLVYLEDNGGIRLTGRNRANYAFTANYRIIGWVNQQKLGKTDCSITSQIILAIMNKIPSMQSNQGIYQRFLVEVLGQDAKSYNPFTKYSYDEDKTQYLMYPYDYFSLPIQVSFEMNPACANEFEIGESLNCNLK